MKSNKKSEKCAHRGEAIVLEGNSGWKRANGAWNTVNT